MIIFIQFAFLNIINTYINSKNLKRFKNAIWLALQILNSIANYNFINNIFNDLISNLFDFLLSDQYQCRHGSILFKLYRLILSRSKLKYTYSLADYRLFWLSWGWRKFEIQVKTYGEIIKSIMHWDCWKIKSWSWKYPQTNMHSKAIYRLFIQLIEFS